MVISHQVYIYLLFSLIQFPGKKTINKLLSLLLLLQAVLRALYAYFADRPLKEIPHLEVIMDNYLFLRLSYSFPGIFPVISIP